MFGKGWNNLNLGFLGGEINFPKRFILDTNWKGFKSDCFCSQAKLEATVTRSQQLLFYLKSCSSALFFKYILLYKVRAMWMEICSLWNIYFCCFCKILWHVCFYRKGGLLSQNSLDFQGGETTFSYKRDHQEKYAWCYQITVILDTAHYILDIRYIKILPEYTDSELVTCLFFKDSFIRERVCSTKTPLF